MKGPEFILRETLGDVVMPCMQQGPTQSHLSKDPKPVGSMAPFNLKQPTGFNQCEQTSSPSADDILRTKRPMFKGN